MHTWMQNRVRKLQCAGKGIALRNQLGITSWILDYIHFQNCLQHYFVLLGKLHSKRIIKVLAFIWVHFLRSKICNKQKWVIMGSLDEGKTLFKKRMFAPSEMMWSISFVSERNGTGLATSGVFQYFFWVLLQPFRGNPEYRDVADLPYNSSCLANIRSKHTNIKTLGKSLLSHDQN